jgi:LuxR family maltose regulon positive regulatory protein
MDAFRVAWLSLDEADNHLSRFLTYLIASLQSVDNKIGQKAVVALQSPDGINLEDVLTNLINDIAAFPHDIVLILDDYHVIETPQIDQAITFFIEHLPTHVHIVIASRIDPTLPLSRLRARNQMIELRANNLRFTSGEAAEFLNQTMGLDLSSQDVKALTERTEGWVTGLQMAAISMQGRPDTTSFIQAFTGSHRFVLDYLVEEVLMRQPEHVRNFLLQTSILERLTGSLCDSVRFGETKSPGSSLGTAVNEGQDGNKMLANLERENLFVIPLDDEREWYRYHHIFADVLRDRLAEEQSDQIPILHQRASDWYAENDLTPEAVHHALAAENFERVAALVELSWQTMDASFQSAVWLDWVKELPDDLIRNRPVLSTQYAWALIDRGNPEIAEARLQNAERWLDTNKARSTQREDIATEMVITDATLFQSLPAMIALARANQAQYQGDPSGTIRYAEQALKLLPEEDHIWRAQATVLSGITNWASGNLDEAQKALADWSDSMQKAGNLYFAVATSFALADIMIAQGHLQEAVRTYQQSLELASEAGEFVLQIIAHHHLGLAMLYHEMDDEEASAQHLQKCEKLGKQSNLIDWPHRWCLAQAQLKTSAGDWEAALDLLDEARRVYIQNPVPDIRPVESLKARIFLKQGRLVKAQTWVHNRGLAADDEISYLSEFEHLTLARVFIAQYQNDQTHKDIHKAVTLLDRLLLAAQEKGRNGSILEILITQALAYETQGNTATALAPLEQALTLAEPEGYLRIFVDEGSWMTRLLYNAMKRGIKPDYVQRLLGAFHLNEAIQQEAANAHGLLAEGVEPLSERETEVLQLISEGLTNQEIAGKLHISLHTVKGHARNIYGKLGVKNRTQAIAKGKALGILTTS